MRIIKFRAWDVHQVKMYYFENDCMWDTNWLNTCYVMQFTGLLDKNGKEIYEGDIIIQRYGEPIDRYFVCVFCRNKFINIHLHSYANFLKGETNFPNATLPNSYGATIIGNIYSNPELLK